MTNYPPEVVEKMKKKIMQSIRYSLICIHCIDSTEYDLLKSARILQLEMKVATDMGIDSIMVDVSTTPPVGVD